MKVIIDIPKDTYEYYLKLVANDDVMNNPEKIIVKGTPINDNATNGDMMKAMFPSVEIEGIGGLEGLQCVSVSIGLGTSYFALDWWNSPYKKEVE